MWMDRGPLKRIPFSCSGFLRAKRGTEPENPRGLRRAADSIPAAARYTRSGTALALLALAIAAPVVDAGPIRVVRFNTSDGVEIVADFREAKDSAQPAPVAVLLHMYQSNRSAWKPLAEALQRSGFAVLAIDMRGHGQSGGKERDSLAERAKKRDPSLFRAMYLDVAAAHTWLGTQRGCDVSRVTVIGASVGCSVAIDYASRDRSVDVVVAMTPGTNYLGVDSTKPIVAIGKRPVLLLATEKEREATDELARLSPSASGEIVAPGRHHGTNMFGRVAGVEDRIVEFVLRGVGDRLSEPVVSVFGGTVYYESESSLRAATGSGGLDLRKYSSAAEAEARGLKPGR